MSHSSDETSGENERAADLASEAASVVDHGDDSIENSDIGSLGGSNLESQYHPLAIDAVDHGIWGWIDRTSERVSGWMNPILIKEARQSLKSRQFLVTFFLLLTLSCIWTIMGVVSNAPDVYFLPTGTSLLYGYLLILTVPLIGIVPLAAHRSLGAEIDDDTFEMLVITRLDSMRIVMGKLNSAVLQMLIYFAAIVPCLAFSYLLRGVNLPSIALVIATTFFTALLVTSFSLMMATLAFNRAGQTIAILCVLATAFFAVITCYSFCSQGLLGGFAGDEEDVYVGVGSFIAVGITCIFMFIKAAAARIAPVTENRSTGLRRTMMVQQLVWIATICLIAIWANDYDVLNFGSMILAGYWLIMGALMLVESPELSPRVQRTLPSTFAGRALLTWFNPGPATGYVFAITTGCAGIFAFGSFGMDFQRSPRTPTLTFSLMASGYLLAYLGLTRLIAMPIIRRLGRNLAIPTSTLAGVMFLAMITPMVIIVVTTGMPASSYTEIEAINWSWTLIEAFDNGYDWPLAILIFGCGGIITLVNLFFVLRVFQYRRISVPDRVKQELNEA